jgi:anti-sigma factor RsiW
VIGGLGGFAGSRIYDQPQQIASIEALPQQAQAAYLVYASEVRHPVEVFSEEEAHLATWLGKRLNIPDLKIPDLSTFGFQLVGGRLLPVDSKPGAFFMYEDAAGKRLSVIVGRNPENRDTSFRFASNDGVETFYWIDGELGYAVSGEISRDQLRQIAEECYRQFPS